MKKKQFIFFTIILVCLITLSGLKLQAQETLLNNKLTVQIGGGIVNSSGNSNILLSPIFIAGVNYMINRIIDIGVYGGIAYTMHRTNLPYNEVTGKYEWYSADSTSYITGTSGFYRSSQAFYYGVNSNIHLLPLFFGGNMRIDLYATPKIGWVSEQYYAYNATIEKVWSKPFIEYSMGLGLKYYFGRRFGIYGEYSLGRFYNSNNSRAMTGLVIKF